MPPGENDGEQQLDLSPAIGADENVPEAVAWLPVDMSRVDVAAWLAIE